MDNSFNNINNNLHNIDLLMLGNKGKKYNINNNINEFSINEDFNNNEIILRDFKINKKEIKNKINDLYSSYLDTSNNKTIIINNKVDGYFYLFIQSVINNIKNENIKSSIQNELISYNNKNNNNNNKNNKNNKNYEKDNSYNELMINNKNKNINIEQYLDIKKINNIKILPKKRS
tara:strand:+ start:739 stop:1263 length:525 start_codon:yes stop_codon:yes gene_type:complete